MGENLNVQDQTKQNQVQDASETRTPHVRTVSRRNFLKVGGGFLGAVLTGGALGCITQSSEGTVASTVTPTPTRLSNVPQSEAPLAAPPPSVRLPDAPPPEILLQQTAVALDSKGLKSSFQEKAGFTEKMFEEARSRTVLLTIIGDEQVGNNNVKAKIGTGFIIKQDKNSLYLVTNKHLMLNIGKLTGLSMLRPNLDRQEYIPTNFTYAVTPGNDTSLDIAVIKCEGSYPSLTPLPNIDRLEKQNLQGKDVLVVGFPEAFRKGKSTSETAVLGSVMKAYSKLPNSETYWVADGLISSGASGSPVFLNEGNRLKLVGVVNSAAKVGNVVVQPGQVQTQWHTTFRSLEIENLLNSLK